MPEVKRVSLADLDRLGIDENNKLYWDNLPLVTEEKITLQKWVNFAIVIGAVSTFAIAILDLLKFGGYGS